MGSAAGFAEFREGATAFVAVRRRRVIVPFDRGIYLTRNRIERLINRLKQYRRVATRYEKRAENYQAMPTIAAIMLWL